jgi:hypothetical protein
MIDPVDCEHVEILQIIRRENERDSGYGLCWVCFACDIRVPVLPLFINAPRFD